MQNFKIFYSWQSDLPGNRTRNFIRECIDEAIVLAEETETIEAQRDEATLGTTGSPDIVSTLFSKIDDCDLFIADVSLCFSKDQEHKKRSPNPNVLLELGYAAKTLGWDRIVCFCNTDYGDNYPFDIAHNRITTFSLDGKSKAEVKSNLVKIIFINIRDIRKLPPKAKSGAATHIIGSYDFETHNVVNTLKPVAIGLQEGYILHNEDLLRQSQQLFIEIQSITEHCNTRLFCDDSSIGMDDRSAILSQNELSRTETAIHLMAESYKGKERPVVWKNADEDKERIARLLHSDVSEYFFDLDGLKAFTPLLSFQEPTLSGPEDEKTKYKKLEALSYNLLSLDIRTTYLKTFAGMLYIPLAIKNISAVQDTDIRVVVTIENGEIVEPNRSLICEECDGLQGCLCRDDDDPNDIGIIGELFCMCEDGVIHIEDAPWNSANYMPKIPTITENGLAYPEKTEKDYEQELKEFIATTRGAKYYEFEISSLRPGECKWMNTGMLLKPIDNTVTIRYRIHSSHSAGDLEGTLSVSLEWTESCFATTDN